MNFNSFTLRKYSKKKSKVVDDRPFTSISDRSKEKLMNRVGGVEKTGRWVNCTNAANDSDDDPSDYDFKSFNHYFDEPIYSEPDLDKQHAAGDEEEEPMDMSDLMPEPKGLVPFAGEGVRLDGKKKRTTSESEVPKVKQEYVRGIPDYDYEIGLLKFIRHSKPKKNGAVEASEGNDFEAFKGEGKSLRQTRK